MLLWPNAAGLKGFFHLTCLKVTFCRATKFSVYQSIFDMPSLFPPPHWKTDLQTHQNPHGTRTLPVKPLPLSKPRLSHHWRSKGVLLRRLPHLCLTDGVVQNPQNPPNHFYSVTETHIGKESVLPRPTWSEPGEKPPFPTPPILLSLII